MKIHQDAWKRAAILVALIGLVAGCATSYENRPKNLQEAQSPAWALKISQDDMIVAVSPAGKALRLAGSAGLVVGTAVDLGVNAKYARKVDELLEGYDTAAVYEARLAERLGAAVPKDLRRVNPLGTEGGYDSRREAEEARFKKVARDGADILLDLRIKYGIYGPEGTMALKTFADLYLVPEGKRLWDAETTVTTGPVFADAKLGDVTNRAKPSVSSGLTVDKEAMEAWMNDDGTILRGRFEEAVNGAVSALLCGLGLTAEASGEFQLAKDEMNRKHFDQAEAHFLKAIRLAPESPEISSAHAVNLAHMDKLDQAIAEALRVVEANPGYGPAWFNLAWWYATEKSDPVQAARCYEKAQALGMPSAKKIEKAIADR